MTRREDHPERGSDDVEAGALIGERVAVSLVEANREPRGCGCRPRLLELVGGDVEPDHVGAGPCRPQRHPARPAGEVEDALSPARIQSRDEALVDRGEGLGDALVSRPAP